MMILEIDVGNTRAKWRLRHSSGHWHPGDSAECRAVEIVGDVCAAAERLQESFGTLPWSQIENIWVSNVRGRDFEEALTTQLQTTSKVRAVFPKATKHCAGVTNGYDEPERLGIDRWLAILAAYNKSNVQCCVVDCGTTITLDLVDSTGLHLGGYIVPGIVLMKSSLTTRSPILQPSLRRGTSSGPGSNTGDAINNGVFAMITAFIKQLLADYFRNGQDSALFFTGGDGLVVKEAMAMPCLYQPELVLDGLQIACSDLALSPERQ